MLFFQEIIQHEINQQPQHYAGTPKEVDQTDISDRRYSLKKGATSPSDVNSNLRQNISERSQAMETSLGTRRNEKSKKVSGEASGFGLSEDIGAHCIEDRILWTNDDSGGSGGRSRGHVSGERCAMNSLKKNIESSYCSSGHDSQQRHVPMETDSDDDYKLEGRPFETVDTLTSLQTKSDRRYDDENETFEQFSGLSVGTESRSAASHDLDVRGHSRGQGHSTDQSLDSLRSEVKKECYSDRDNLQKTNLEEISNSAAYSDTRRTPSTPTKQDTNLGKHSTNKDDTHLAKGSPNVQATAMVKPSAKFSHLPAHYVEEQLLRTFIINGLKVTLYHGNLIMEETDAIVNPASENLEHYGGVAYAISKARGKEMTEECRKYLETHGSLKATEVMHTSGGGQIKSAHVIHAAGPMWLGDTLKEKFSAQLIQTFLNCLKYADSKLWIRSLALPVISSGTVIIYMYNNFIQFVVCPLQSLIVLCKLLGCNRFP